MPILLTDIQVPVVERKPHPSEGRLYGDYLCTLCETSVSKPEPHTLDECLRRLFELLKPAITITREDVLPK